MASPDPPARRKAVRAYRPAAALDQLVMTILDESNHALSAYDVHRQSRTRKTPLTMTQAYRVLRRLMEQGRVQRIELLSAYFPIQGDMQAVAVCRRCKAIATCPAAPFMPVIAEICRTADFAIARTAIEILGLCPDCSARRGVSRG